MIFADVKLKKIASSICSIEVSIVFNIKVMAKYWKINKYISGSSIKNIEKVLDLGAAIGVRIQ